MEAVITTKQYYCPVCGNTDQIATNHFGEIYPKCKVCDCGTMYLDDDKHGHKFTMDGYCVSIVPYRFNIGVVSHKRMYQVMKEHLEKDLNYKIFNVHAPPFGKSKYHEEAWRKQSFMNVPVVKEAQFDNQFITNIGRLHKWFEFSFPNKDILTGYYLILPSNKYIAKE